MARAINRLTARKVQTETTPGRHADGAGLYLVVDPGGAKRWAMLISIHGRRRELGLGNLSSFSLAEAREEAEKIRRAVARGEDPKKPREPPPRFAAAAAIVIEELSPGWRGRDTKAHWTRSLLVYAADIADMPIDLVSTDDVVRVVKPIWRSRPESGRKLRQRIETLLDVAAVKGWREGANPARLKGHLERLLPKQPTAVAHRRAISYDDAPAFMKRLAQQSAMSARALEWTILTAAREGMTRFATWGDIQGDVWVVPANKMKEDDRGDFRVPLTAQALAVLDTVRIGEPALDALIFPGAKKGQPMSDQTMDSLLARMKVDATPHGFRSTFRDWAGDETDHAREVAEAALAHVVGDDTERAYRRRDALAKRRRLMEDWADFLMPRPAPADEEAPREE